MSWENPGSNPLSAIGESVVGDIGGTAEVRLVTSNYAVGGETYYIGLLTSNSDPNSVTIDPVTGEPSPIGTDVGFGAPLRRYVQSGIYNADFASPPPDTSAPISDDNPLPYWRFVGAASSNITATWEADSESGSGGVLRWYMGPGDASDSAYIEQLVPVNASRGQNWMYWANAEFGQGWSYTGAAGFTEAVYLRNDGVTATGASSTDRAFLNVSSATVVATATANDTGVVPSDAAWLRLRVGIDRYIASAASSNSAPLYETWVSAGGTNLLIVDDYAPSTVAPAQISQTLGNIRISPADPIAPPVSITSNGCVLIGPDFLQPTAQARIRSDAAARPALAVQAADGQTADIMVVENTSGTDLVTVAPDGSITQQTTNDPLTATRYAANTFGPAIFLSKSRNATIGSHTVVQSGDALGGVMFRGSDGTTFRNAAFITAEVDGTPGSSDMPGRLIFQTTPDGSATLAERMRIDSAGRVGIGVNPSNTNGGVLQLSGGITFPATAVAASDANTLDDYEEGTWTPAITFATPGNLSVTYSQQIGRYTRIGRYVFLECMVQTSAFTHTTASGALAVTGLPFTVLNSTTGVASCAFRGWTDTLGWIGARASVNSTNVDFVISESATALSTVAAAIMPTGGTVDIRFQLGYVV